MADGSLKPIEDVEVGELVLATDPETGKTEPRAVVRTIVGDGEKELVEVSTKDGTVVATAGHPFWVDDEGRWVEAGDLDSGDVLLATNGERNAVTTTIDHLEVTRVHNLTVEGIHTYYVRTGSASILVHNCGGKARVSPAGQDWGDEGCAHARGQPRSPDLPGWQGWNRS